MASGRLQCSKRTCWERATFWRLAPKSQLASLKNHLSSSSFLGLFGRDAVFDAGKYHEEVLWFTFLSPLMGKGEKIPRSAIGICLKTIIFTTWGVLQKGRMTVRVMVRRNGRPEGAWTMTSKCLFLEAQRIVSSVLAANPEIWNLFYEWARYCPKGSKSPEL